MKNFLFLLRIALIISILVLIAAVGAGVIYFINPGFITDILFGFNYMIFVVGGVDIVLLILLIMSLRISTSFDIRNCYINNGTEQVFKKKFKIKQIVRLTLSVEGADDMIRADYYGISIDAEGEVLRIRLRSARDVDSIDRFKKDLESAFIKVYNIIIPSYRFIAKDVVYVYTILDDKSNHKLYNDKLIVTTATASDEPTVLDKSRVLTLIAKADKHNQMIVNATYNEGLENLIDISLKEDYEVAVVDGLKCRIEKSLYDELSLVVSKYKFSGENTVYNYEITDTAKQHTLFSDRLIVTSTRTAVGQGKIDGTKVYECIETADKEDPIVLTDRNFIRFDSDGGQLEIILTTDNSVDQVDSFKCRLEGLLRKHGIVFSKYIFNSSEREYVFSILDDKNAHSLYNDTLVVTETPQESTASEIALQEETADDEIAAMSIAALADSSVLFENSADIVSAIYSNGQEMREENHERNAGEDYIETEEAAEDSKLIQDTQHEIASIDEYIVQKITEDYRPSDYTEADSGTGRNAHIDYSAETVESVDPDILEQEQEKHENIQTPAFEEQVISYQEEQQASDQSVQTEQEEQIVKPAGKAKKGGKVKTAKKTALTAVGAAAVTAADISSIDNNETEQIEAVQIEQAQAEQTEQIETVQIEQAENAQTEQIEAVHAEQPQAGQIEQTEQAHAEEAGHDLSLADSEATAAGEQIGHDVFDITAVDADQVSSEDRTDIQDIIADEVLQTPKTLKVAKKNKPAKNAKKAVAIAGGAAAVVAVTAAVIAENKDEEETVKTGQTEAAQTEQAEDLQAAQTETVQTEQSEDFQKESGENLTENNELEQAMRAEIMSIMKELAAESEGLIPPAGSAAVAAVTQIPVREEDGNEYIYVKEGEHFDPDAYGGELVKIGEDYIYEEEIVYEEVPLGEEEQEATDSDPEEQYRQKLTDDIMASIMEISGEQTIVSSDDIIDESAQRNAENLRRVKEKVRQEKESAMASTAAKAANARRTPARTSAKSRGAKAPALERPGQSKQELPAAQTAKPATKLVPVVKTKLTKREIYAIKRDIIKQTQELLDIIEEIDPNI